MAGVDTKYCRRDGADDDGGEEAVDEFYSGFEGRTAGGAETRVLDDAEVPVVKAQALPQKKQF